jgi:hypothetical protein
VWSSECAFDVFAGDAAAGASAFYAREVKAMFLGHAARDGRGVGAIFGGLGFSGSGFSGSASGFSGSVGFARGGGGR